MILSFCDTKGNIVPYLLHRMKTKYNERKNKPPAKWTNREYTNIVWSYTRRTSVFWLVRHY